MNVGKILRHIERNVWHNAQTMSGLAFLVPLVSAFSAAGASFVLGEAAAAIGVGIGLTAGATALARSLYLPESFSLREDEITHEIGGCLVVGTKKDLMQILRFEEFVGQKTSPYIDQLDLPQKTLRALTLHTQDMADVVARVRLYDPQTLVSVSTFCISRLLIGAQGKRLYETIATLESSAAQDTAYMAAGRQTLEKFLSYGAEDQNVATHFTAASTRNAAQKQRALTLYNKRKNARKTNPPNGTSRRARPLP